MDISVGGLHTYTHTHTVSFAQSEPYLSFECLGVCLHQKRETPRGQRKKAGRVEDIAFLGIFFSSVAPS